MRLRGVLRVLRLLGDLERVHCLRYVGLSVLGEHGQAALRTRFDAVAALDAPHPLDRDGPRGSVGMDGLGRALLPAYVAEDAVRRIESHMAPGPVGIRPGLLGVVPRRRLREQVPHQSR